MCVLDLHSFIFRFSGGSEKDLCSECKSKWNDLIIFYVQPFQLYELLI